MEKNKIKFINEEKLNEDAYLWRYVDLHKFLSFLFTESLYLTRLDKFEDKREGISTQHLITLGIKDLIESNPGMAKLKDFATVSVLGSEINQLEDEMRQTQRFSFANCWFVDNENIESMAMWNLYSQKNSVAIRVRYKDFKEKLINNGTGYLYDAKEIVCGPIDYINFQDSVYVQRNKNRLKNSVFIKDKSYEHEKEFRLIVKNKNKEIPEINYKPNLSRKHIKKLHDSIYDYSGLNLKLNNFRSYNFEIVLHPKSDEWAINNIRTIMGSFGIDFKLFQSSLKFDQS